MPFGVPDDEYQELLRRAKRAGISKARIDNSLRRLQRESIAAGSDGVIEGANEIPLSEFDAGTDRAMEEALGSVESIVDADPNADLL